MAKTSFAHVFVAIEPAYADFYKVEIISTENYTTKKGNARVGIKARVLSGVATGTDQADFVIGEGFNEPTGNTPRINAMMEDFWMKFWHSLGYDQAAIRKKGYDFEKTSKKGAFECLVGRTGYVRFLPKGTDREHSDKTWLSEAQFNVAAEAHAAADDAADVLGLGEVSFSNATPAASGPDPLDAVLGVGE